MVETDRYARQRLIEWWKQDRLQAARVLVAGAGALGNELLKNLALLGVGYLLIIDFDQIEYSNLSRTTLFNETDIGKSKVDSAAKVLTKLNPDVSIHTINGDLFHDVGLGYYRHCHLVIGCLDNLAARSQVGLSCVLAGTPYLDGGMWSLGGEVRWFTAGNGPCFDCTLDSNDRVRADERRSCSGFRDPTWDESERVPTVATTASIIGGLLAQEAAKWLCDYPITAGKAIVYNGQALTMHRSKLERNPNCSSNHTPYQDVIELPHRSVDLTVHQLLNRVRNDLKEHHHTTSIQSNTKNSLLQDTLLLELGRDFLIAFNCSNCGRREEINQLWGKVLESSQSCPHCGTTRHAEVVRTVDENSPYVNRPLTKLGIPPGEILAVRTPEGLLLYELTADIVL
jgi:molybdopterin/thiamine biosynthesis adenylyltransferase